MFLKHLKAALLLMTMLEGTAKDAQSYAETYATYLWTATDPQPTLSPVTLRRQLVGCNGHSRGHICRRIIGQSCR